MDGFVRQPRDDEEEGTGFRSISELQIQRLDKTINHLPMGGLARLEKTQLVSGSMSGMIQR